MYGYKSYKYKSYKSYKYEIQRLVELFMKNMYIIIYSDILLIS